MFGEDDTVRAGRIGAPDDCAQVLRVADVVEHQQKAGFSPIGDREVVEVLEAKRCNVGDGALMAFRAGGGVKLSAADLAHRYAALARLLDQRPDALPILRVDLDEDKPGSPGTHRLRDGVGAIAQIGSRLVDEPEAGTLPGRTTAL
jgi:hypothetical protein